MQLNLKGQIIILDEAHNIEDICREVASVSFREDHLQVVVNECETVAKERFGENPAAYTTLCLFISRMLQFLSSVELNKSVSRLILRNNFFLNFLNSEISKYRNFAIII